MSELAIDHIAYQASSAQDFDKKLEEFKEFAKVIRIPMVGGRRVAVMKLKEPWKYKDQTFEAFELIEPVEGKEEESRLEHVEFITPYTLEELVDKYPDLEWDTTNQNRDEFPMIKLRIDENTQVKFPREGII